MFGLPDGVFGGIVGLIVGSVLLWFVIFPWLERNHK